ncbi:MAG: hypothetical protein C0501_20570 [Isosphaera sp.]|nr:hypothetical protein [Isosphaera sp.]
MTRDARLPPLSRVEFYRLREGELVCALAQAVARHGQHSPDRTVTADHRALLAWARLSADVPNGGFAQFFYNHRGDAGVEELARLLDSIDVPKAGALLRDAAAIYRRHQSAFRVDSPWDGLFGSIKEFEKLDRAFTNLLLRGNRALERWIRSHIGELATDEAGNPIDVRFTGGVEILQPNGLVGEYLEVKNGKPSGAYREFFDDGTVRKVVFYRAGKITSDFWPDGQLKRKEFKRGPHTVIEWYHPGGGLQKRYVRDKDGHAAEPVRLYHENGNLAEELHTVGGRKSGPWLKFFDDGSPRLQAEFRPVEKLVVRNAWAADRTQVVKDGAGVFHDDGRGIDWAYSVFFEHSWQHDRELKGAGFRTARRRRTTTGCCGAFRSTRTVCRKENRPCTGTTAASAPSRESSAGERSNPERSRSSTGPSRRSCSASKRTRNSTRPGTTSRWTSTRAFSTSTKSKGDYPCRTSCAAFTSGT